MVEATAPKKELLSDLSGDVSTERYMTAFANSFDAAKGGDLEEKYNLMSSQDEALAAKHGIGESLEMEWLEQYVGACYKEEGAEFTLKPNNELPLYAADAMYNLAVDIHYGGAGQFPDWDRDGLLYESLLIELDKLEITNEPELDEENFSRLTHFFGIDQYTNSPSNDAFDRHVLSRTTDALMEMQSDLSQEVSVGGDSAIARGFTSKANTHETQAADKAMAQATELARDKDKMQSLLIYMQDRGVELGKLSQQYDME